MSRARAIGQPVRQMPDHFSEAIPQSKINLCVINRLMKSILHIAALAPL